MRISDWSSDVCSSDLRALQAEPVVDDELAAHRPRRGTPGLHHGGQRHLVALVAPARRLGQQVFGRQVLCQLAFCHWLMPSSRRIAGRLRTAASPPSLSRLCTVRKSSTCGISRSEEHTSELQQLMRKAYAIFCLTKKNR